MRLRVHGDADREVADAADEAHELDRVLQLARRQLEVGGRIAAQREDVLDPGVARSAGRSPRARRGCARRT